MKSDVKIHINGTDINNRDIKIYVGEYEIFSIAAIEFKIKSTDPVTYIKADLAGISFEKTDVPSDDDAEIAITFKDAFSDNPSNMTTFNNYHMTIKIKGEMVGGIQEFDFNVSAFDDSVSVKVLSAGTKALDYKFPDWVNHTHKIIS